MAKSQTAKSSEIKQKRQLADDRSPDAGISDTDTPIAETIVQSSDEVANRFVGQWNRLISTTNGEKGRIICQWREALMTAGVSVTQYSDEAWAQLVGSVTSQHVGRLRRVFQRFGDVFDQYEGLYWSHFQAALDWDDAEMWLEGAIQNEWSISQMRGKRWETLGTPVDQQVQEEAFVQATLDEDAGVENSLDEAGEDASEGVAATDRATDNRATDNRATDNRATDNGATDNGATEAESEPSAQATAPKRQRLDVALDDLPDDIAEAFEQFKLAIIAQRHEGWQAISPDGVIECLDALKTLVSSR